MGTSGSAPDLCTGQMRGYRLAVFVAALLTLADCTNRTRSDFLVTFADCNTNHEETVSIFDWTGQHAEMVSLTEGLCQIALTKCYYTNGVHIANVGAQNCGGYGLHDGMSTLQEP